MELLRRVFHTVANVVFAFGPECREIVEGPLFDAAYYRSQCRGKRGSDLQLLRHYMVRGFLQGLDPHPLFSTSFYLEQNHSQQTGWQNPLRHFLQLGYKQGRAPHPLFIVPYYLSKNPELAEKEENVLLHYLQIGSLQKCSPHPLFDPSYYLATNPDVEQTGEEPLSHYIRVGRKKFLRPHPLFDPLFYANENPDVQEAGVDLLHHYSNFGYLENRSPHPLFDVSYYLQNNPDVAKAKVEPLHHYLTSGAKEERNPHPLFHTFFYQYRYGHLLAPQENPLMHFVQSDRGQQLDPHPLFNSRCYQALHPEAGVDGLTLLLHFLGHGYQQGEDPYRYRKQVTGNVSTICICTHWLPRFLHDSGSVRLYKLVQLLVGAGYKVIIWGQPQAVDDYPIEPLRAMGVELPYTEDGFRDFLKEQGKDIDLVILCRLAVAKQYLDSVLAMSDASVFFDTVDLNFLREERMARTLGKPVEQKYREEELHICHCADEVLVVSPVEKEILDGQGLAGKVSIVSNIHTLHNDVPDFAERSGLMFIGGFEHQPNVDGIRWFVQQIYPQIRKEIPGIHLDIVGSFPPESVLELAAEDIHVTGFVEDVAPYFLRSRLFVSPLRFGAGVKGKIGQAISFGLPVVTTSTGAEGMYLLDGVSAMIADEEQLFAQKTAKLYQDRALWRVVRDNGSMVLKDFFSPMVAERALVELIEKQPKVIEKKREQKELRNLLGQLAFPQPVAPLVSIIIPTYGQLLYTVKCLYSIMQNLPEATVEIIVIDDASPPEEGMGQLADVPGLQLLVQEVNCGFTVSVNNGCQQARGEFLYLLNNDTEVTAGWLEAMVSLFEQDPDCAIVGSKLVYPEGCIQEAGGIVWKDGTATNYGNGDDPQATCYNYVREVDYVSGASLLIQRSLFMAIGQMDIRYAPAYYEDTDLAFRVRAAGKKVLYQPQSVVIHHEGVSHGRNVAAGLKQHQIINRATFVDTWCDALAAEHFAPGTELFRARDRKWKSPLVLLCSGLLFKDQTEQEQEQARAIVKRLLELELNLKCFLCNVKESSVDIAWLQTLGVEILQHTAAGSPDMLGMAQGLKNGHVFCSSASEEAKLLSRYPAMQTVLIPTALSMQNDTMRGERIVDFINGCLVENSGK